MENLGDVSSVVDSSERLTLAERVPFEEMSHSELVVIVKRHDAHRRALEARIRNQRRDITWYRSMLNDASITRGIYVKSNCELRKQLLEKHVPGHRVMMDYLTQRLCFVFLRWTKDFKTWQSERNLQAESETQNKNSSPQPKEEGIDG